MRPKILRCNECGGNMYQGKTEYKCINCGHTKPRFIRPDTTSPLFLMVKTKNDKDKKFLEDIMQEPVEPHRSWFFSQMDTTTVFVRTQGKRHLDVYKIDEWCEILAKEIREREGRD